MTEDLIISLKSRFVAFSLNEILRFNLDHGLYLCVEVCSITFGFEI